MARGRLCPWPRWHALLLRRAPPRAIPAPRRPRLDARIGDLRAQAEQATAAEGVLTTELSGLDARVRAAEAASLPSRRGSSALEASLAAERRRLAALEQQDRRADGAARRARSGSTTRRSRCSSGVCGRSTNPTTPTSIAFALGTTSFSDLLDNSTS